MKRRESRCFGVAGMLVALAAAAAHADSYPKGPITIVVPLAAGDASDLAARAVGEELSGLLKVPVLVVNRPGAGGALGVDSVIKGSRDGYTLGFAMNAALTVRRVLDPQTATYDPMKDITPLGLAMRTPTVVAVRGDLPVHSLAELIAYARSHPGELRIGTAGPGSAGEFDVATISGLAGTDIVAVPFKGASPAVTAVRGGHVEGVALALGVISVHLRSGAIRAIVASSRFPDFPDIATLADLGYAGKLLGVWAGFFGPAGLPPEATAALVPAIEKAVKSPAIGAQLHGLGMVEDYQPPDKLLAEIQDEYRMVQEISRKTGLAR
jgi:tripartite-type tricarboxylate transporter receptor subunit TctC